MEQKSIQEIFLEEGEYQKIKQRLNKKDDYFNMEELQKINKNTI